MMIMKDVTEAVKIHMSTMCKECAHRSRMPDIYNGKLGDGSFGKEMNDRWSPICSDHRALLEDWLGECDDAEYNEDKIMKRIERWAIVG